MRLKKPIYMFQCQKCKRTAITRIPMLICCGVSRKWSDYERGNSVKEKKVRIEVSGYIEMSEEAYNRVKEAYSENLHMGLVYSIHMGYTDTRGLEFDTPDE